MLKIPKLKDCTVSKGLIAIAKHPVGKHPVRIAKHPVREHPVRTFENLILFGI
jgi:hypothetical protein